MSGERFSQQVIYSSGMLLDLTSNDFQKSYSTWLPSNLETRVLVAKCLCYSRSRKVAWMQELLYWAVHGLCTLASKGQQSLNCLKSWCGFRQFRLCSNTEHLLTAEQHSLYLISLNTFREIQDCLYNHILHIEPAEQKQCI